MSGEVEREELAAVIAIMRALADEYEDREAYYGVEPKGWPKTVSRMWAYGYEQKKKAFRLWADKFEQGFHLSDEAARTLALAPPRPPQLPSGDGR